MTTMRAIVVTSTGGPDALTLQEVERPVPGPGELLVKTRAAGVNFIETYQRSGVYPVDLPFRPGSEGAGEVVEIGSGVEDAVEGGAPEFSIGDLVATSEASSGTYAEFFVVEADRVTRVPDGIDPQVAAAIPLQGLTAHYLATSAAQPQPGDTALVHAGAGGVGLLLTQLLVARGVRVITTASTDGKRELSRAAGASESFGYEGFAERARSLTGGAGVNVVYDGVGRDTFDESLHALRIRGAMVLFGGASGQVPPFDLQRLNSGGSLSITRPSLGHFLQNREERAWRYGELFDALHSDKLNFRVGARFPLEDASEAHEALESRQTTGKVILTAS